MKSFLIAAGAAVAALTFAPAASAATYLPGSPQFQVSFAPNGSISATIGHNGISSNFDDSYVFTLLSNGLGSGSVIANFTSGGGNAFAFTSATINGMDIPFGSFGPLIFAGATNVPLLAGENIIRITGTASGNVSYGGTISFVPNAVPEPATWAMMLVGFGMVGGAVRYRRRATKVVYA